MFKKSVRPAVLSSLLCPGFTSGADVANRTIPHPLPSHPGNVFLKGENIEIPLPPGDTAAWRAVDYDGKPS